MSMRRLLTFAIVLSMLPPAFLAALRAQEKSPPPRVMREAVSLETSSVVSKQLEAARDEIASGQWIQAFELLDEIRSNQEAYVTSISPGRYVSTGLYSTLLLSTLPAEGLAAYRARVDSQAANWLETAKREHDESRLWTIVDRAFCSRYGDDALNLLGEWLWERGEIDAARACWMRILPPMKAAEPGKIPAVLQYPDTDLDPASVAARLVLCSLAQENAERAAQELDIFRKLYPDASGKLASKEGKFADILTGLAADRATWKQPNVEHDFPTFALNAERNSRLPGAFDVGSIEWSQPLPRSEAQTELRSRFWRRFDAPAYFPATYGDIVLVNSIEGIHAWNLKTGEPAWPDHNGSSLIYRAFPEGDESVPFEPVSGTPQYTMSIDKGRLFARVGLPMTEMSNVDELRGLTGRLVCLDLARGEGKLLWSIEPGEPTDDFMFAGSPLVRDGKLYVVLHRGQAQTEIRVACYDCDSGNLVWIRKVCATSALPDDQANRVNHQLLTWGEGTLYLSTDAGAIAALDARDGQIRWVITYESHASDLPGHSDRAQIPCLYFEGLVIAAPRDHDSILGIDACCGGVIWECRLRGAVDHLMGVGHENLIVAGDRLWGVDVNSGDVRWSLGSSDPASFGYGRGLLVGNMAYWPKRDELFVVDVRDGQIERRVALDELHRSGGGNLAMARGMLFIARPDELVAFGQYSRLPLSAREQQKAAP